MDLPLFLDIATGLLFVYLIFSLLASEIQELLTTLLQWRADHLKKSIENLLTGETTRSSPYQEFIDDFYNSPLLRSLNQEAKGILPRFFRSIVHHVGQIYRGLTGSRNVFGRQRTGPSYIPSETFAHALLQRLDVATLSQKVSEYTISKFRQEKLSLVEEVIADLRNSLGDDHLLEAEVKRLREQLAEVAENFKNRRISLPQALEQATEQLQKFVENTEEWLKNSDPCKEIVRGRLPYVKQGLAARVLEPTISEVLSMIFDRDRPIPPELQEVVDQVRAAQADLPPQLRDNLRALAQEAELRSQNLRDGVRHLELEVENWFNRSMERASGVYKRNAKGVAIIIGVLLAASTNTDTFHIVDRLSRDSTLRMTITQTADQVISQTAPTSNSISPGSTDPAQLRADLERDLDAVKAAVDNALRDLPLPIGWDQENLRQQLPANQSLFVSIPRMALGYLVSGIALSMGAAFWFDVLSKVMRVRNSGAAARPNGKN